MEFLQTEFASNSLQTWLIAVAIVLVILLLSGGFYVAGIKYLTHLADRNKNTLWAVLLAMLRRTSWLFLLILALFIASAAVEIADKTRLTLSVIVIMALLIQAAVWASASLQVIIEKYRQRKLASDPASVTTLNILNFASKIVIWSIALLLILDNLGVNVTALVAGLGIGGIAVALALQNILGDLFASLSIVLDKPFVVGDFLIMGDFLGSVEYIGMKTTRLRSLSGEQLIFSNLDLLNSRIRNYGRMYERRVVFNLGVTYQTPRDKLITIPHIVREAVEKLEKTRFDRSHFKEYGDFALAFESVYYVLGPDYNEYMDIQQAINLHIHERFEQEGIVFAYPTQTLYVQQS